MKKAFIGVDLNNDFMPKHMAYINLALSGNKQQHPGGTLPVAGAHEVIPGINQILLGKSGIDFDYTILSQDYHDKDNVSFYTQHPGTKPFDEISLYGVTQRVYTQHCVKGTWGAELHPEVMQWLADLVFRKGIKRDRDSNSVFNENVGPDGSRESTGFGDLLRGRGIQHNYFAGIAGDICVDVSVCDSIEQGFKTTVFANLCRSVVPVSDNLLHQHWRDLGVEVLY